MVLALYTCSVVLLSENYYLDQRFTTILLCTPMAHGKATGQTDRSALCSSVTSRDFLQKYVLPLLWLVHLKPIFSSTADDGDDTEQTPKALQGGNYFLSTPELFLLYGDLRLRFIKGNRTTLFSSQSFPLDANTGLIILSAAVGLHFSDYFS